MTTAFNLSWIFLGLVLYIPALTWASSPFRGPHDVFIEGPNVTPNNKAFSLTCNCHNLQRAIFNIDPYFSGDLEIEFTADGQVVDTQTFHPTQYAQCHVPLTFGNGGQPDNFINHNFSCEVKTTVNNIPVAEKSSYPLFLGIRAERNPLIVKEGQTSNLRIISNVPVLCENSTNCCITVNLQLGGSKNNLAAITKCNYQICTDDWIPGQNRAVLDIPLEANYDEINGQDTTMWVKFRPLLPAGGGDVHQIFKNIQIDDVNVKIEDKPGGTCYITGDPHIRLLEDNSRMAHLFDVGEYIFYENKDKDFQLHGKTWPCTSNLNVPTTCVCGLVARQGNDIIRISLCDDTRLPPGLKNASPKLRLDYAQNHAQLRMRTPNGGLPDGTTVNWDQDDQAASVNFHTGVQLEVKYRHDIALYLKLSLPPSHADNLSGRGACGVMGGTYNGNLVSKQGTLIPCTSFLPFVPDCWNKAYTDSWRLQRHQSLFRNPPTPTPTTTTTQVPPKNRTLCGCLDDGTASTGKITCDNKGNQQTAKNNCPHCGDITNNIPPGMYGGNWVATKRGTLSLATPIPDFDDETFFDVFEYEKEQHNSGIPPPVSSYMSGDVAEARRLCTASIKRSVLMSHCENMTQDIHSYVGECISDYLVSRDIQFVNASVHAFNMKCMDNLYRDPKNYKPDADGVMTLLPELSTDVCSQTCIEHGTCTAGTCVCDPGWSGAHCNRNDGTSSVAPTASSVSSGASSAGGPTSSSVSSGASSAGGPTSSSVSSGASSVGGPTSSSVSSGATTAGGPKSSLASSGATTASSNSQHNQVKTTPHNGGKPAASPNHSTPTPTIKSMPATMCDVALTQCDKLAFSDQSKKDADVTCTFVFGDGSIHVTSGQVQSDNTTACPVPPINVGLNKGVPYVEMTLDVKIDATLFQRWSQLTIFDSRCVDTNLTTELTVCTINGKCFADGIINPGDDEEGCDISKSTTDWSKVFHAPVEASDVDLTLSGPNENMFMTCTLANKALSDMKLTWLLNGQEFESTTIVQGGDHVTAFMLGFTAKLLGNPGRLQCRAIDSSVNPPLVLNSNEVTVV